MVVETGKISIRDLEFSCIIGTLPYEREQEQPVVLNISVWLDFSQAARNEDLAHSIDYVQLADDVQNYVSQASFQLEETLVLETAKYILNHYPKTVAAEVSVRKPLAIPNSAGAESCIKVIR
ncbi:dihydroneopterin aldolase [uncultured Fibrobacter sp.]|uniref:dihydroneopterin aldolase n=1 Tax=uncultured Fibrobacter sp. TaxID=261512 RepID=UPI002604393C|nr:dihydroneopterin aldolase [uncultured Fibrobacter sp.]